MKPLERARRQALALPGTTEQPHHGRPSFRVGDRIFATLPGNDRLNVLLDPDDVLALATEHPGVCEPVRWGHRVRAVQVNLDKATPRLIGSLLEEGWARKAPPGPRR